VWQGNAVDTIAFVVKSAMHAWQEVWALLLAARTYDCFSLDILRAKAPGPSERTSASRCAS
jgi:hypothetical protein